MDDALRAEYDKAVSKLTLDHAVLGTHSGRRNAEQRFRLAFEAQVKAGRRESRDVRTRMRRAV